MAPRNASTRGRWHQLQPTRQCTWVGGWVRALCLLGLAVLSCPALPAGLPVLPCPACWPACPVLPACAALPLMRLPLPAGRPDASINGGLAVAVPLELQGMWLAHRRHGKLPWARLLQVCAFKLAALGALCSPARTAWLDCLLCMLSFLLQPAIQLAESGFPAHPYLGGWVPVAGSAAPPAAAVAATSASSRRRQLCCRHCRDCCSQCHFFWRCCLP